MSFKTKSIGVPILLCCLLTVVSAWGSSGDKVKLKDVQVLTLNVGQFTNGRRSAGVPQIRCLGGTAGCQAFVPQVVQCYNRGFDGGDFQWECKADMDNAYRFGSIAVTCEGYDYPEDEYVLRGSCGLEYTIDYTKEGYQRKSEQTYGSNYQQPYSSSTKYPKGKSGLFSVETIILGAGLGLVVYAIYKTCIANEHTDQRSRTNDDYGPRPDTSSRPPPAGFRSEYYQGGPGGGDSCSGGTTPRGTGSSSGAGGFWTGAATGGLLGYMFGSSGSNTGYNTYARPRTSGWGAFDNWGSNTGGYSGGYSGGGYSAGPSTSSGSRSASGFGGTRRR